MSYYKISQILLTAILKNKIDINQINKINSKIPNKLTIYYAHPFVEVQYLMKSNGGFSTYKDITYENKIIDVCYCENLPYEDLQETHTENQKKNDIDFFRKCNVCILK